MKEDHGLVYVQILLVDGTVIDVTVPTWTLIKRAMQDVHIKHINSGGRPHSNEPLLVEYVDLYGDPGGFRPGVFSSYTYSQPASRKKYLEMHGKEKKEPWERSDEDAD